MAKPWGLSDRHAGRSGYRAKECGTGFASWSAPPPNKRSHFQSKTADLPAALVTLDFGKPLRESLAEAELLVEMFRWAAGEAQRLYGLQIPSRQRNSWHLTYLEPVRPVAAFSSWNLPLNTPARKLSGTLAAGCSVNLRSAEETPSGPVETARILVEADVPPEAFSIVFGDPQLNSDTLLQSPVIQAVSFTGSTGIERQLSARSK